MLFKSSSAVYALIATASVAMASLQPADAIDLGPTAKAVVVPGEAGRLGTVAVRQGGPAPVGIDARTSAR